MVVTGLADCTHTGKNCKQQSHSAFSIQQSAISIQPNRFTAKDAKKLKSRFFSCLPRVLRLLVLRVLSALASFPPSRPSRFSSFASLASPRVLCALAVNRLADCWALNAKISSYRLRISAISFLNTAPLMSDFEKRSDGGAAQGFPAQLYPSLRTAPSSSSKGPPISESSGWRLRRNPDLVLVPDVAIAAKTQVRWILLVSKVPLGRNRSVATDASSRTSAALVEIYCASSSAWKYGIDRQEPSLEKMIRWHDAALLIGDPALQARTKAVVLRSLAEEWRRWTGRSTCLLGRAQSGHERAPRGSNMPGYFKRMTGQRVEARSELAKAQPAAGISCGLRSNTSP